MYFRFSCQNVLLSAIVSPYQSLERFAHHFYSYLCAPDELLCKLQINCTARCVQCHERPTPGPTRLESMHVNVEHCLVGVPRLCAKKNWRGIAVALLSCCAFYRKTPRYCVLVPVPQTCIHVFISCIYISKNDQISILSRLCTVIIPPPRPPPPIELSF